MRYRSQALVTGFFLCMLAILLIPIKSDFNSFDEGFAVLNATRMMSGDVPYRDFWTLYPPGQTVMLAAIFQVFGTTLMAARIYDTLIRLGIVICVYLLARKSMSGGPAVVVSVSTTVLLAASRFYAYSVFPSLALGLLGLLSALRYVETGRMKWLIVSGALTGLAMLFRWDIGLYAGISTASAVFIHHVSAPSSPNQGVRRSAFLRALGPVAIMAGAALLIAAPGYVATGIAAGFDQLWDAVFVFPTTVLRVMRLTATPSILPFQTQSTASDAPVVNLYLEFLYWLQFYFPLLIFAIALLRHAWQRFKLRHIPDVSDLNLIALSVLGLGLFNQALNRYDYIHILPSSIMAFVVAGALASDFVRRQGRAVRLASMASMAVPGALYLSISIGFLAFFMTNSPPPGCFSRLERASCIRLPDDQQAAVAFIEANTRPGEPIFVGNQRHDLVVLNDVGFYFLADRPSATRYDEFYPGSVTTQPVQDEIVRDIQSKHVTWIILVNSPISTEPNPSSVSSGVHVLDAFIRNNYSQVAEFGDYEIWEKKPN